MTKILDITVSIGGTDSAPRGLSTKLATGCRGLAHKADAEIAVYYKRRTGSLGQPAFLSGAAFTTL